MLRLRPITIQDAKRCVARWHRHNDAPKSALFAVAVEKDGEVCGVAIIGRPIGRGLQDGWTCETIRVATDGTRNACSMLYGAAARAAKALGYRRIITYTLATEPGVSLRASGWTETARLLERESWSCAARNRQERDLFGERRRASGAKVRWEKVLVSTEPLDASPSLC